MKVAIVLFDGITALDAVGPYEVLSRLPGTSVAFAATEPRVKRTDRGLGLVADVGLSEQLSIEHDPEPPYGAGSTRTAPPEVVELVRSLSPRR